jgi:hypothetical protein
MGSHKLKDRLYKKSIGDVKISFLHRLCADIALSKPNSKKKKQKKKKKKQKKKIKKKKKLRGWTTPGVWEPPLAVSVVYIFSVFDFHNLDLFILSFTF